MRVVAGVSIAIAALIAPPPGVGAANGEGTVQALYLAPDGDDRRSGRTPKEALRSLDRVQQMLRSGEVVAGGEQLSIRFLPGEYRNVEVIWDYFIPGHRIIFEPAAEKHSAVLDGRGSRLNQFFILRVTDAKRASADTGITIRGLKITNYCEGISLGNWESKTETKDNIIEDNAFYRIGSKYQSGEQRKDGTMTPSGRCVAALRIRNSSKNIIRKNTFSYIENLPSSKTTTRKYGPTLLHAIYISHDSNNNMIKDNSFGNFTGSPIRIRSRSNFNSVINNTFHSPIYIGQTRQKYRIKAISQWYCNDAVETCVERAREGLSECPSIGLRIVGNRIMGDMELYADDSQSPNATCPSGALAGGSTEPLLERNTIRPHTKSR